MLPLFRCCAQGLIYEGLRDLTSGGLLQAPPPGESQLHTFLLNLIFNDVTLVFDISQGGMFTAQKLANAKNQGVFLSRKPGVK